MDSRSKIPAQAIRRQSEGAVAEWWENLGYVRQGGWYGKNTDPVVVQHALDLLERIHVWATQMEK